MTQAITTKLTDDQKKEIWPYLSHTWSYIAGDSEEFLPQRQGPKRADNIIELVCDASRPVTIAKMPNDLYNTLCSAYDHADTKKWLRSQFKNS